MSRPHIVRLLKPLWPIQSLAYAAALAFGLTPDARAEDPVTADITAGVFSGYMFRGIERYDGASFQPSAAVTADVGSGNSITAELWAHLPLEGDAEDPEVFREVDGTLSATVPFGPIAFSAGHTNYLYPRKSDGLDDTAEFFAEAAFSSVLNPRLTTYHDYRANDALGIELALHDRIDAEIGQNVAVVPFIVAGWSASHDPRYERDGLAHISSGLMLEVPLGRTLIVPNAHYTHAVDDAGTSRFWAGLVITTSVGLGF